MKKKTITLFLAAIMAMSLMACGDKKEPEVKEPQKTEAEQNENSETTDVVVDPEQNDTNSETEIASTDEEKQASVEKEEEFVMPTVELMDASIAGKYEASSTGDKLVVSMYSAVEEDYPEEVGNISGVVAGVDLETLSADKKSLVLVKTGMNTYKLCDIDYKNDHKVTETGYSLISDDKEKNIIVTLFKGEERVGTFVQTEHLES